MTTRNSATREQYEESSRQLGRLVDLSGDAFIVIDTTDRIHYWNRGAERMYGYTSEEAVGALVYELIKTEFPHPFPELIAQLQREGRWVGEVTQRTKAGDVLTVLTRWEMDAGTAETGPRILKNNTDITARKKAEEDSRQIERLVNLSSDAIVVIDFADQVHFWNRGAELMYGYTRAEAMGGPVYDLLKTVFPVSRQQIIAELQRDGRWSGELTHTTKEGKNIVVLSRWELDKSSVESSPRILKTNTNITDRKKAEEALARQAAQEALSKQAQEILEISTPVLQVWDGVVVAPLIGSLDSQRTQHFMERLLNAIVATNATVAIVDITGVPTIDTQTAQHLIDTINAVQLLGAKIVLTGVRPAIAQAVVHLGIDLSGVTTRPTLMAGLRAVIESTGAAKQ